MAALIETMAYTGEVPWHGLGNAVSPDMTPEQMVEAAGLNWEVHARPIRAFSPESKKFTIPTDDWRVLVRSSDNAVFGPCGKKYQPVQNTEALDFFTKFTEAGHMKMETAGSLDGGKQVWGLARLDKQIILPGDDKVNAFLLLSNPHVWGKSMNIMFTPIRVVCMNTLMMALHDESQTRFRHPHVRKFDEKVAKEAELALGIGMLLSNKFEEQANRLARHVVDDNVISLFAARVMVPKAVEKTKSGYQVDRMLLGRKYEDLMTQIKNSPGAHLKSSENTLWGAVNGVTYYYDHVYGNSQEGRLTNAWFGPNRQLKERAFNVALEIADELKLAA
jgi:phage/plasmid-like protein (TIGR03299 family)